MFNSTWELTNLKVVSSLWLEYPLELRTWRFARPWTDLPDLRDGKVGLAFRDRLDGEFSDDDDVSPGWSEGVGNFFFCILMRSRKFRVFLMI